jgi:hypothetical protein
MYQFLADQIETKKYTPRYVSSLSKFPVEFYSQCCPQANVLVSPNLQSYLTFDSKAQAFVVHGIERGVKQRLPMRVVLDGLFNQEDTEFDAENVAMNFKWENDFAFRVVNKEGYEKLIMIRGDGDWLIKDSTFVPMKNMLRNVSMFYFEQHNSKVKSTFERLLRKYQRVFTNR